MKVISVKNKIKKQKNHLVERFILNEAPDDNAVLRNGIYVPQVIADTLEKEKNNIDDLKQKQNDKQTATQEKTFTASANPTIKTAAEDRQLKKQAAEEAREVSKKLVDNGTKKDWQTEFSKILKNQSLNSTEQDIQLKQLWEDYYEKEWGAKAGLVKALGSNFVTTLQTYGFSKNENPFVSYVQTVFNMALIQDKPTFNDRKTFLAVFDTIYSGFKNKKTITKQDLLGEGELGTADIIFQRVYFGDLSATERITLLQYEHIIKTLPKTFKFKLSALNNYYIQKDGLNKKRFYLDVFTNDGNIFLNKHGSTQGKEKIIELKPINKIKNILEEALSKNTLEDTDNNYGINLTGSDFNASELVKSIKAANGDIKLAKQYLILTLMDNNNLTHKVRVMQTAGIDVTKIDLIELDKYAKYFKKYKLNRSNLNDYLKALDKANIS